MASVFQHPSVRKIANFRLLGLTYHTDSVRRFSLSTIYVVTYYLYLRCGIGAGGKALGGIV